MFHNNYDVTNKSYLKRTQKSYKVNKDAESKNNKNPHKKKEENKIPKDKKESFEQRNPSDKGNNIDFFA